MITFIDGAYDQLDDGQVIPFIPAQISPFPVVRPVFVDPDPIPVVQVRRPVLVTTSGVVPETKIVRSEVATTLQGPFGEPILLSKSDRLVYPTCHLYVC
jgi:hypothetical protein